MENEFLVPITKIRPVTHDVRSYRLEKPPGYHFNPGQATEVSIHKPGWEKEKRPFTFTSLNDDPELEFTIKSYSDHQGVTNEMAKLQVGDQLVIRNVWGAIEYKGPGIFIAGGAGITPFIAIFRQLHKDGKTAGTKLFFSNKTDDDVILEDELRRILGDRATFIITDKPSKKHLNGFIDEAFLKEHITDPKSHFYLCGPPKMVEAINQILLEMGASADAVVFEK